MKNVLILQPELDQSMAIAKYLKTFSNNFFIIGGLCGRNTPITKIPYFDKINRIFEDTLLNCSDYDIILPTGANSTHSLLSQTKKIKVGNIEFNQNNISLFDKIKTLNIINNMGIPVPITYFSIDEITEYPIFYKQAIETGGGQRGIIRSKEELKTLKFEGNSLIFQEYIDSPYTFGVGFLANEGELVTSFIQKEIMSFPRTGGSGVVLTKYEDDKLIKYTKRILKNLNYNGWGLVEFKYCPKRNDYVFMEVNAKFWASIEFAFFNNPIFLKELFGIEYKKINTQCIVYLNRLAYYGIINYFQNVLKYKNCHFLYFKNSLRILLINFLVGILKKFKNFIRIKKLDDATPT